MKISSGYWSTTWKPAPVQFCSPQIPYDLGSNTGRRCGKPATNRLSYRTVVRGHNYTWSGPQEIESSSAWSKLNWIRTGSKSEGWTFGEMHAQWLGMSRRAIVLPRPRLWFNLRWVWATWCKRVAHAADRLIRVWDIFTRCTIYCPAAWLQTCISLSLQPWRRSQAAGSPEY
jgi:hypothetical protein